MPCDTECKTKIAFDLVGLPAETAPCLVVWGHGWGMNRAAFRLYADALAGRAAHMLVDFPGFGDSPVPPPHWGTADYADALAELVRPYRAGKKIIYVGHSFGGRVGIQLAARHPDLVDGLFLVGAHGLIRKRSLWKRIRMGCSVYTFKTLKHLAPVLGLNVDDLRKKFGSADYRNAGAMRSLFLGFIREAFAVSRLVVEYRDVLPRIRFQDVGRGDEPLLVVTATNAQHVGQLAFGKERIGRSRRDLEHIAVGIGFGRRD